MDPRAGRTARSRWPARVDLGGKTDAPVRSTAQLVRFAVESRLVTAGGI